MHLLLVTVTLQVNTHLAQTAKIFVYFIIIIITSLHTYIFTYSLHIKYFYIRVTIIIIIFFFKKKRRGEYST